MQVVTFMVLLLSSVQWIQSQVTNSDAHYTKLSAEQIKHLQNRGFGPTVATAFRTSASYVERNDGDDDSSSDAVEEHEIIAPASSQQVRRPIFGNEYLANAIPVQPRPVPQQQQQQYHQQTSQQYQQNSPPINQALYRKPPAPYLQKQAHAKSPPLKEKGKLEEELEEEEPDRLALLLPQSKFDCSGKNTGYYADEDLDCEVFHYCQDNAKHSWICPEGFSFHQVHLICMPPGGDNNCAKSSQYHFVNEYLYKPLNLEEHQRKPNVSLRYSERYYPKNYYDNNGYDDEEVEEDEEEDQKQYYQQQRKPVRVGLQQVAQQKQVLSVARPPSALRSSSDSSAAGQVFRSPDEVNISLQQRKPQYVSQRYREELAGY